MDTLHESFLEYDLNPFMVFSSSGKLLTYNQEAEYLLSFVPPQELYDLAVNYAAQSFGFRSTHVNLRYDRYSFCIVLVGYLDDDKIGLKLYKEVSGNTVSVSKNNMTSANLFALLELSKNSILASRKILITESFDPTIPEMRLHVEKFLKLLNKVFSEYTNTKGLELRVSLKIGQNMLVEGKSYPICNIVIIDRNTTVQNREVLHTLATEANVVVIIKEGKTIIEFPIID
ncbi:MAG: hypothetical protein K0U47_11665 [Epsilonproteobacteria bacterium]|nr:hypothetical protein [Campylobacterota bacterium]